MKNRSLRLLFHCFASIHFTFSCYYDWNFVRIPFEQKRHHDFDVGKLKFLTFWDAILQSIFFTLCTFADIRAGDNKEHTLRKIQNTLMTCLAYPLAMFVGTTFWLLYAIDRELVFPKSLDPFFPVWLNHCMHTNIMIFIIAEMYTHQYVYPQRSTGLKKLIGFMLVYLIWIHVIYQQTNVWVYPVLEVLNLPMRIVFFLGLLGISVGLYISGEKLNRRFWKNDSVLQQTASDHDAFETPLPSTKEKKSKKK